MEIQLYKALIEAGVKEETAARVVDSLENEIKERMQEAHRELATKAGIANMCKELTEAKAEIVKWHLGAIIAVVGVMLAMTKFFSG